MEKNKHILLQKYKELDRPISKYELKFLQKQNKILLNLSHMHIKHENCNHTYLCKRFGKKFKLLQENNLDQDIGNCSVCWKIYHTDFLLKKIANDLAAEYAHVISTKKEEEFSYYEIELEKIFHSWLYK